MPRSLQSTGIFLMALLLATSAPAIEEMRCDSDFYDLKNSMTSEEFADTYIDTMLVPELDRDEQAVWRSVVSEKLSPKEAANRHVEQFYSMESKADLASRLEKKANALNRIRELVQVREYSDPPVDWLVRRMTVKWDDDENKIRSDFFELAAKYRDIENPKVVGSARAWWEAYHKNSGPHEPNPVNNPAIGSCSYFQQIYDRARIMERDYYIENSNKQTSSHELTEMQREILGGNAYHASYERIMNSKFEYALQDELRH